MSLIVFHYKTSSMRARDFGLLTLLIHEMPELELSEAFFIVVLSSLVLEKKSYCRYSQIADSSSADM